MGLAANQLSGPEGVVVGHRTIDEIGKHQLVVSPQNYEIWVNYVTHSMPDLNKAVDALAESGELDGEHVDALYEKFFSTTQLSTQVMETGSRITTEIADALDALNRASTTTERYGQTLSVANESLQSATIDGDGLKRLVSALTNATTEMSKQNSALSQKLSRSSQEIDNLRTSLRKARAEALTDALTGIANRKLFDETLRLRKEEADTEGSEMCLALCDIDHFKSFNDTWGHQTGDQVIRFVASTMTKLALPDHLVARYGGEEFAIVMPRTTMEDAVKTVELIRSAIEAKRLVRRSTSETIGAVTVSFGVAKYNGSEQPNDIVKRADECLYRSKENGRNRVTTEEQMGGDAAAVA